MSIIKREMIGHALELKTQNGKTLFDLNSHNSLACLLRKVITMWRDGCGGVSAYIKAVDDDLQVDYIRYLKFWKDVLSPTTETYLSVIRMILKKTVLLCWKSSRTSKMFLICIQIWLILVCLRSLNKSRLLPSLYQRYFFSFLRMPFHKWYFLFSLLLHL